MTLKKRFLLTIIVVVFSIASTGVVRYYTTQSMRTQFETISQETMPIVISLLELQVIASHMQKDAISYWFTYDLESKVPLKIDSIFNRLMNKQTHFDNAKSELEQVLARYLALTQTDDPSRTAVIAAASRLSESTRDLIKYETDDIHNQTILALKVAVEGAEADFLEVTSQALAIEMAGLDAQIETALEILNNTLLITVISFMFTLAVLVVLRVWVAQKILQVLTDLEKAAQAIASGDFDIRLNVVSQDELGSLVATFNQMTVQLKRSFDDIADYAKKTQAANDLQSALLSSVNHAVLVLEGPEKIVKIGNKAIEQTFGYSVEEVVGQPIAQFFTDLRLYETLLHEYTLALAQNTEFHIDHLPYPHNGELRFLDVTVTPLYNGTSYAGDVAVVYDVTKQHLQHQMLLESEAKYRELFKTMNEGFALHELVYDDQGQPTDYRYLEVNPAFETLTGLSKAMVEGKTAREVLPKITQDIIDGYVKVVATGETLYKEDFVPDLGRYFRITAFRARPGQFVSTFQDITDRVEASKELERSEILFRTMTETMPASVVITQQGAIVYQNPATEQWQGSQKHRLSTPEDYLHPDSWLLLKTALEAVMSGQEKQARIVYRADIGDTETYWLDSSITKLNYQGQPSLLIITIDVTDQVNAKAALEQERTLLAQHVEERTGELRQANIELAQAIRHKDEFLASMSHELRTPLNAILGITEVMSEEIYGPLNEKQHKRLRDVDESGRHLLDLINDVLDVAKIDAGKLTLEVSSVEIKSICEASLRMIREAAFKKQLRVETEINITFTYIQADGRRLKQMLMNLLSNAVKFTPEAGNIGLSVSQDALGETISFSVWDTGIGIAPEEQARLFQPFVQVDSRLSRAHEGSGLGLALVHKMTKLHGGTVSLESEPGKGSRFTITLPVHRVPQESGQSTFMAVTPH